MIAMKLDHTPRPLAEAVARAARRHPGDVRYPRVYQALLRGELPGAERRGARWYVTDRMIDELLELLAGEK